MTQPHSDIHHMTSSSRPPCRDPTTVSINEFRYEEFPFVSRSGPRMVKTDFQAKIQQSATAISLNAGTSRDLK